MYAPLENDSLKKASFIERYQRFTVEANQALSFVRLHLKKLRKLQVPPAQL